MNNKWDLYIATSLKQENSTFRNQQILKAIQELNINYYMPKVDVTASDKEIFIRNKKAVENSAKILFVPDEAGDGVFLEIGLALGLNIPIYGYSPNGIKNHGKMARGLWDSISSNMKTDSIHDLTKILIKTIK